MKTGEKVLKIHNMYVHSSKRVIEAATIKLCEISNIDNKKLFLAGETCEYNIINKNMAVDYMQRKFYKSQNLLTLVANPLAPVIIENSYDYWDHIIDKKQAVKFLNDILSNNKKYYNGCPICLYPKHHKDNNGKRFKNNTQYIQYLIKELSE